MLTFVKEAFKKEAKFDFSNNKTSLSNEEEITYRDEGDMFVI
jgi:hypothetical protein